MPKRTEHSFDTNHRLRMHELARETVARDPELEPWQVAARFGIDAHTARKYVRQAREQRRP